MSGLAALFTMWRSTRLVVLTSVLAAIHAAALIPFKMFQLLPGVTDVRPGMVLPIAFSLMFGPAAAWGTAIGNTIGDLFGSLGPGTLFGFAGNLLYGYLPWRIWRAWRGRDEPRFRSVRDWSAYALVVVAAAGACALVIGWGIHLLGLFPFATTSGIILVHNLLVGLVLGPPIILAIHPRVARMQMLYEEERPGVERGSRSLARAASLAVAGAAMAGIVAGYLAAGGSDAEVTGAAAPFVLAMLIACALL